MRKKFWLVICFLFIALGMGNTVYASDVSSDAFLTHDDPQAGREKGQMLDGFYSESANADPFGISLFSLPPGYTHNPRFDGRQILNGIDVSYYQGGIDWNAVKADGIDFAIIRVGYRGYGSSGNLAEDVNYVNNIRGALSAGLDVGVYIYSQAVTTQEAVQEAEFVLSRIGGFNITFPVAIDYEYASVNGKAGGRLYDANLSQRAATDICKAFANRVASAGYTPMVYANKSMLENRLYASEISATCDVWLANYTKQTSYGGDYTCWQYTSSGNINGISGRVDLDFWYSRSNTEYHGVDYSSVYNYNYYISTYSDMNSLFANNPAKAIAHFVENGMAEGRQGIEDFNVYTYRNRYVDLRSAYGTDLKQYYLHYMNHGKAEGRSGAGTLDLVPTTVYKGVDYSAVYNFYYYTSVHEDMKAIYADNDGRAIEHFVEHGMAEGRQGNEEFNVHTYRNRYMDLRSAYGNNYKEYYLHYLNHGKAEDRSGAGTAELIPTTIYKGVDYSSVYNFRYYTSVYSDMASVYGNDDEGAIAHFVEHGMAEGRQGSEEFNAITYRNRYADLRNAFKNDLKEYYLHYVNYGKSEGRSGAGMAELEGTTVYEGVDYSSVYNFKYYIAAYSDMQAVYANDDEGAIAHFVEHGMAEGRQGSEEFNAYTYRNRYSDLRSAFGNNYKEYYLHYVNHGKAEGRSGAGTVELIPTTIYNGVDYSAVYNFNYYISVYGDMASVYGNDDEGAIAHFVEHGMSEGRQGNDEFNVNIYRNQYDDLNSWLGDDLKGYYLHYINAGRAEGRVGNAVLEKESKLLLTLEKPVSVVEENENESDQEFVTVPDSEVSTESNNQVQETEANIEIESTEISTETEANTESDTELSSESQNMAE